MIDQKSSFTGKAPMNLDSDLKFCKANLFPNLRLSYGIVRNRENFVKFGQYLVKIILKCFPSLISLPPFPKPVYN